VVFDRPGGQHGHLVVLSYFLVGGVGIRLVAVGSHRLLTAMLRQKRVILPEGWPFSIVRALSVTAKTVGALNAPLPSTTLSNWRSSTISGTRTRLPLGVQHKVCRLGGRCSLPSKFAIWWRSYAPGSVGKLYRYPHPELWPDERFQVGFIEPGRLKPHPNLRLFHPPRQPQMLSHLLGSASSPLAGHIRPAR